MRKRVKLGVLGTILLLLLFNGFSAVSAANVYNITDESYSNYFNSSGYINDMNIQSGDVLDCYGTFTNRDMYIDRPLNITSSTKTGKIVNGTITILPSGSWTNITDLAFNNINHNGADCPGTIVLDGAEGCTVANSTIVTNQTGDNSYGVHLVGSNNVNIVGNSITTTGDAVTHGIFLEKSNDNEIRSNNIQTTGNEPENGVFNLEFPTLGIYLKNSSDNVISGNAITTSAENNSVASINLYYNSNNNKIIDNSVKTTGEGYVYGLTIYQCIKPSSSASLSTGNVFSGNNIKTYGNGYSDSVNLGWYSSNTTAENNTIFTSADAYAYGLVMIGSFDSTFRGNNVTTESNINYGATLEDESNNNSLIGNNFVGTGKYSLGIALCDSGNNTLNRNDINVNGDVNADPQTVYDHSDPIPATTVGVYMVSGSKNNAATDNKIISNGKYAVDTSTVTNSTITGNCLVSAASSKMGDGAVNSASDNILSGNYGMEPVAGFSVNINQTTLSVQFNNTSSFATSYEWNFGDESTSSEQNPSHTYIKPGSYTVTLKATGPDGSNSAVTRMVVGTPESMSAESGTSTGSFTGSSPSGDSGQANRTPSWFSNSDTAPVNAVEVTKMSKVPMQRTGVPISGLTLAVLAVLGGLGISKRRE